MLKLILSPVELVKLFYFAGLVFSIHLFFWLGTDLYYSMPNIDLIFHFLGGLSIAHGFMRLVRALKQKKALSINDRLVYVFAILALTALAATIWEFLEFGGDYIWHLGMQEGLQDTMVDMFLGLVGGAVASLLFSKD